MAEITEDAQGYEVKLEEDTRAYHRTAPDSSRMIVAWGVPRGKEVKIGGLKNVTSFLLDGERQPFVFWIDSGEKEDWYFLVSDMPWMVRMVLSPVSGE